MRRVNVRSKKKPYTMLLIGIAVLAVFSIALIMDTVGNVLPLGSDGISCGGEFNYRVQCPDGYYCRETPRTSISTPYLGGICAPISLQALDQVEETLFHVHR
jgi:hypothetical protein